MNATQTRGACSVAVIHPHRGVGDLMWHLPYIRAIAKQAPTGQVALVTRPSTRADRLLAAEPSVAEVIYTPFARGSWNRLCETWTTAMMLRRRGFQEVWILERFPVRPYPRLWPVCPSAMASACVPNAAG